MSVLLVGLDAELARTLTRRLIAQDESAHSDMQLGGDDWIKVDLHIHTLDDPKDALDYSAHEGDRNAGR